MNACNWLIGFGSMGDWSLACSGEAWPALLSTVAALAVLVVVLVWLFRKLIADIRDSGVIRGGTWVATCLLVPLAALGLAIAAGGPVLAHTSESRSEHLVLVVDHSGSASRQAELRSDILQQLAAYLAGINSTPEHEVQVSVVAFAGGAQTILNRGRPEAAARLLLADALPSALDRGRSEIAAGLREAERVAEEQPEGDLLVLVSDGNDTAEDLAALAEQLVGSAPIHVLPLNAGPPEEGIVSAYLPSQLKSGAEPTMRVVFDPGTGAASNGWTVSAARNGEPLDLGGDALAFDGAVRQLRFPVGFEGRGLQFAEVTLADDAGSVSFSRRLVTLVNGPIRVLAMGDGSFLSVLPPEEFTVTQAGNLPPDDFFGYDVVVLDDIAATQLQAKTLDQLAAGITSSGLGLLLVNGPMHGTPEDPTTIQSYGTTPLDMLLPVSANPRFLIEEPPPRDVIVMVDTSGSMAGGGLDSAKTAISNITDFMRPQDRIQVVTFAPQQSGWINGTPDGMAQLGGFLNGMSIGDASDASGAFQVAARDAGNYTAVFLITDGAVADYDYRKDGMSFYYLEVGGGNSPANPSIVAAANQWQKLFAGQGLAFKPEFFEPEERTEFFNPAPISPRLVDPLEGIVAGLDTPGVALSFARVDAKRILVSDTGEAEPVLASRKAEGVAGGSTAAFLSQFGPAWTTTEAGRTAIASIVSDLSAWSKRERYDLRFTDLGSAMQVQLTVVQTPDAGGIPEAITAELIGEGTAQGLQLTAVPGEDGVFDGRIDLPATATGAWSGLLVLSELGGDGLAGAQVIPIQLPPPSGATAAGREAVTQGINIAGLRALAEATGGRVDELPAMDVAAGATVPPRELHLGFLIFSSLALSAAVLGKEMKL